MNVTWAVILIGIAFVGGAAVAASIVYSAKKSEIEAARTVGRIENQAEITRFAEQLSARETNVAQMTERLNRHEAEARELRTNNSTLTEESAKLKERVTRIPVLEADLAQVREALEKAGQDNGQLHVDLAAREQEIKTLRADVESLRTTLQSSKNELQELSRTSDSLSHNNATLSATLTAEREQHQEKLSWLEGAKAELANSFKVLSNQLLAEETAKFTEHNHAALSPILEPLKEKIVEFQKKVEEVYTTEGKERVAISEQLKRVLELNQQLSSEANALTRALKGSGKKQGDWGEMILDNILNAAGLRRGHEYESQQKYKSRDGSSLQPDVIVHLPDNKHLIIDSKVSLTDYEIYVNSDQETTKDEALERHINSIRTHFSSLSESDYQTIPGLNTLDFVIMFVPIESAFILAVSNDGSLWQDAWKKNVIIVSPSTLLFAVRTIANIWRWENQNQHALEIAKRGAELYDKFVGFVADLQKVGERLAQARESYDEAEKKLTRGRGNLVRQSELLRDLGIKPSKSLPQPVVDGSADSVFENSLEQPEVAVAK